MSQQELNLLQFATRTMAEASTRPSEIVWSEFRDSKLSRVLLNNVPDDFFCHVVTPDRTFSANAPKHFAVQDSSYN